MIALEVGRCYFVAMAEPSELMENNTCYTGQVLLINHLEGWVLIDDGGERHIEPLSRILLEVPPWHDLVWWNPFTW